MDFLGRESRLWLCSSALFALQTLARGAKAEALEKRKKVVGLPVSSPAFEDKTPVLPQDLVLNLAVPTEEIAMPLLRKALLKLQLA